MALSNPILSVIVPAYNAEKFINQAINSILDQTFKDFELIISDDGSIDATRSIIDSFEDHRIITKHNEKNLGKTKTVNNLFKLIRGQYLTIHDADDYSHKDRFQKQIDFLKNNPKHGVCGSGFITINPNGTFFSQTLMHETNEQIWKNIDSSSQIHGPTAIIRTSLLSPEQEIYRAYFENNFEDIDFVYRILSISKGHNIMEYLYYYRILPDSLCRKEITIKNRNLYGIVLYLTYQRKNNHIDDLMSGNMDSLTQKYEEITVKYENDNSLINREAASYYMYWKLKKKAIFECLKAIKKKPCLIINYRTLFYCIRKSL